MPQVQLQVVHSLHALSLQSAVAALPQACTCQAGLRKVSLRVLAAEPHHGCVPSDQTCKGSTESMNEHAVSRMGRCAFPLQAWLGVFLDAITWLAALIVRESQPPVTEAQTCASTSVIPLTPGRKLAVLRNAVVAGRQGGTDVPRNLTATAGSGACHLPKLLLLASASVLAAAVKAIAAVEATAVIELNLILHLTATAAARNDGEQESVALGAVHAKAEGHTINLSKAEGHCHVSLLFGELIWVSRCIDRMQWLRGEPGLVPVAKIFLDH
eukprot:CAMPEP_0197713434 /NCGR_PEP_ID=MMETSP1338-20131121/130456_1 /TAXON_ID=43686 ORGANISM="Pelagodinium beii, Strain RCC1491" /NCGR_SAMPLE_ID=MMETSP1338 /ASSEMBLY_ACC=CAM_ASM_000754 /LENGTH=269 /DNA_ID=CAMNT_0043297375 /DNA_START=4313 /DNA_END=5124 /DNA_ORIENTATION=-